MRQKSLKIAMIAAGIIAAAVIVFAHVCTAAPEKSKTADATERSAPVFEKAVGAEAVTAPAVQLNEFIPASLLEVLTASTETFARFTRAARIPVGYFETLFQTFIAPNAP